MKLRAVIERITYQNGENGYSILKARVKGYDDLVTLVGNMLDVTVGTVLVADGQWKVNRQYGSQFVVESYEEAMPATLFGLEKYLGSGLVKGIGPKFSKLIVAKFGMDTFDIIEHDSKRLAEVDGIGPKRIKKIHDSWMKQLDIKDVMVFLQGNGVSTAYAAKIYKTYGKESIDKVKANPYCLADDIWGIGFKTADSIAEKMGYGKNDERRCRSGILYTLNQLANEGHVYANRDQLVDAGVKLLEAEKTAIESALDKMIVDEDLKIEDEAIYLPPFYFSEVGTSNKLKTLLTTRQQKMFEKEPDIAAISKKTGITYDDLQAEAIRTAVHNKVMVLTGGPGTGKTTTEDGIIAAFKEMGLHILLAAPTGRAAKRMTEATGMEAKTIHRLLEFNPAEGYKRNDENPLEGDALIIDECSMIDIVLMNSLLKAVPADMRLLLVGDVDQLPSVGAGNVLRDIIDSGVVPVVRLTRIFRQAQTSRIIMNAHAINDGRMPDIRNGKQSDFFFMECEEPEQIAATIVDLVSHRLPNAYNIPRSSIQVLTPMQRSAIGANSLNMSIQQRVNPTGNGLTRAGFVFRKGDRVLQLKNDYTKEVFNGDIGLITAVNMEDRTLTVSFDGKEVEYESTELDELSLAYATTIHKSQGSEYPIVVIPVHFTNYVMLQRNLIYTAVTRAKKVCIVIGQKRALCYAVSHVTVTQRNTRLKERLQGKTVPLTYKQQDEENQMDMAAEDGPTTK
jgi:exodeoxyribonuclease V alpha subunit